MASNASHLSSYEHRPPAETITPAGMEQVLECSRALSSPAPSEDHASPPLVANDLRRRNIRRTKQHAADQQKPPSPNKFRFALFTSGRPPFPNGSEDPRRPTSNTSSREPQHPRFSPVRTPSVVRGAHPRDLLSAFVIEAGPGILSPVPLPEAPAGLRPPQNRPRARSRAGRTSRQVVHQPVRIVSTNSSGSPSSRISPARRS